MEKVSDQVGFNVLPNTV